MASRRFFDHYNLSGESPFDRIEKTGYRYRAAAENIAAGQADPRAVVASWMQSAGHCANLMSPAFTETGVGYQRLAGMPGHVWTQTFASR